jgi:hypothetical protein
MQELDPRRVRVGIEVDGLIKWYEGLDIKAQGTKYGNANQNECTVTIANLSKETRDYILTETSPFNKNRKPKRIIVEAGRVSYGMSRMFIGDITAATPSQPPDITITIKALTGDYQKGNVISRSKPSQMSLKKISEGVAKDLGVSLDYQAKDKNIANYQFSGGALKQVNKLGETGDVNAYIDDGVLVVKDYNVPLNGKLRVLDLSSGMIGIPEVTEQGLKATFLLDNKTSLGSALQIRSEIYPAVNGTYVIYKLSFDIASRDVPFYFIAEAKRL